MNIQNYVQDENLPWVIFSLEELKFAMASTFVESMVLTTRATEVPNTDDNIRGVFHFREKATPLIDLRQRLGLKSRLQEVQDFCQMIDEREQDHHNWLRELDDSVREGREFALTTDPHKCAFGFWYDAYVPESHSMKSLLAKFDQPHRRIHAVAEKAKEFIAKGQAEKAHQAVLQCQNTEMAEMVKLFAAVKKEYQESHRETTIVFEKNRKFWSFAVDSVITVDKITPFNCETDKTEILHLSDASIIHSMARLGKTNEIIFVIDHEKLVA